MWSVSTASLRIGFSAHGTRTREVIKCALQAIFFVWLHCMGLRFGTIIVWSSFIGLRQLVPDISKNVSERPQVWWYNVPNISSHGWFDHVDWDRVAGSNLLGSIYLGNCSLHTAICLRWVLDVSPKVAGSKGNPSSVVTLFHLKFKVFGIHVWNHLVWESKVSFVWVGSSKRNRNHAKIKARRKTLGNEDGLLGYGLWSLVMRFCFFYPEKRSCRDREENKKILRTLREFAMCSRSYTFNVRQYSSSR